MDSADAHIKRLGDALHGPLAVLGGLSIYSQWINSI